MLGSVTIAIICTMVVTFVIHVIIIMLYRMTLL